MPTIHRETMIQLPLTTQKLINDVVYHATHLRRARNTLKPILDSLEQDDWELADQIRFELDGIVNLDDNANP